MSDHNLRDPAGDFGSLMEVRLLRWGESSTAGRTITLELHPDEVDAHPFKTFPSGAKNGQRFWMVYRPIADDETLIPASHRDDGERPLSVTRPVQQGGIHTTDSVEESVLDGGAKSSGQPGCGLEEYRKYTDRGAAEATTAGLTAKARYAAKGPDQKAITRASILCAEESEWRKFLTGEDCTIEQAAKRLREICGVESRGEFADNPEALARFEKLEADYRFLKRIPEQRG